MLNNELDKLAESTMKRLGIAIAVIGILILTYVFICK